MIRSFVVSLLLICASSCSTMEFVQNGKSTYHISLINGAERVVEKEEEVGFYFWGLYPEVHQIDFDKVFFEMGVHDPSNVKIERTYTFKSILWTTLTLGLFMPENYKITVHSKGNSYE